MNLDSSIVITTKKLPSKNLNLALDLYFFNSYGTYYILCSWRNGIFLLTYFVIYYNYFIYDQCFKSINILLLSKELIYVSCILSLVLGTIQGVHKVDVYCVFSTVASCAQLQLKKIQIPCLCCRCIWLERIRTCYFDKFISEVNCCSILCKSVYSVNKQMHIFQNDRKKLCNGC